MADKDGPPPKRPKIALPSLREVQETSRTRSSVPDAFAARLQQQNATQQSNHNTTIAASQRSASTTAAAAHSESQQPPLAFLQSLGGATAVATGKKAGPGGTPSNNHNNHHNHNAQSNGGHDDPGNNYRVPPGDLDPSWPGVGPSGQVPVANGVNGSAAPGSQAALHSLGQLGGPAGPRGPSSAQLPQWLAGAPRPKDSSASARGPWAPTGAQQGPAVAPPSIHNCILVSRRQEGNPLLKHIRLVRWQYADIVPDYMVGVDAALLFLSVRFHLLKPAYLHHRIKELQRSFRLRVLLVHVDVEDVVEPLGSIMKIAIMSEVTLFCAWSSEECARYLETFKAYENKPADSIKERQDGDYLSRLSNALTTVRGVNKTDVITLGKKFGSVADIMKASQEQLAGCPGIGPTKVKRLHEAFHQPFRKVLRQTDRPLAATADVAGMQAEAVVGTATTTETSVAEAADGAPLSAAEQRDAARVAEQPGSGQATKVDGASALPHTRELPTVVGDEGNLVHDLMDPAGEGDGEGDEEGEDGVSYGGSDSEAEDNMDALIAMTQAAAEAAVFRAPGGDEGSWEDDSDAEERGADPDVDML